MDIVLMDGKESRTMSRESTKDICDYCGWRTAGCHSAYFHPTGRQECADYKTLLNEKREQRQVAERNKNEGKGEER